MPEVTYILCYFSSVLCNKLNTIIRTLTKALYRIQRAHNSLPHMEDGTYLVFQSKIKNVELKILWENYFPKFQIISSNNLNQQLIQL